MYLKIADQMVKLHANRCEPLATEPLNVVARNMLYTTVALASIRTRISEVNMADGKHKDWRELCLAVTNESDSIKLRSLIQELIEALNRRERSSRHTVRPPDAIETTRNPLESKFEE
jgi:hypothetical protein